MLGAEGDDCAQIGIEGLDSPQGLGHELGGADTPLTDGIGQRPKRHVGNGPFIGRAKSGDYHRLQAAKIARAIDPCSGSPVWQELASYSTRSRDPRPTAPR